MNPWELHPALVHFPLALLMAATVLDIVGVVQRRDMLVRAASRVLVAGVISALVAAAAGLLAYFTVPPHTEDAHVRLLLHVLFAVSATVLYGVVLVMHSKPHNSIWDRRRITVSLAAAAFLTAAGGLGGYLVYQDGVGVQKSDPAVVGDWKFHMDNLLDD